MWALELVWHWEGLIQLYFLSLSLPPALKEIALEL